MCYGMVSLSDTPMFLRCFLEHQSFFWEKGVQRVYIRTWKAIKAWSTKCGKIIYKRFPIPLMLMYMHKIKSHFPRRVHAKSPLFILYLLIPPLTSSGDWILTFSIIDLLPLSLPEELDSILVESIGGFDSIIVVEIYMVM